LLVKSLTRVGVQLPPKFDEVAPHVSSDGTVERFSQLPIGRVTL
jgi:hypothetical protein